MDEFQHQFKVLRQVVGRGQHVDVPVALKSEMGKAGYRTRVLSVIIPVGDKNMWACGGGGILGNNENLCFEAYPT